MRARKGATLRSQSSKNLGDPFRRLAIPQRRAARLFAAAAQRLVKLSLEQFPIVPYQHIRAKSHSDWTLGILTQSEARRAQICGLLLYATRVRYDNPGMLLKRKKLKVSKRSDHSKI